MSKFFSKLFSGSYVHKSDEDLFRLVQDDDMDAFQVLYERYRRPVYSYLRNQTDVTTAEDLLQDIFMKVVNGRSTFAFKSSLKTWIWTVARNTLIDHRRGSAGRVTEKADELTDENGEESFASLELPVEEELLERTTKKQLADCIQELSGNQREAILLQTQAELSYEETAGALDLTVSALKSLLTRAREKLLDCFRRGGHLE